MLNHRTLMMSVPSGIKVLAFVELPEHGLAILASRNTEGSTWRDSHSVQVVHMVGLQLAVCQVPYLDQLVA